MKLLNFITGEKQVSAALFLTDGKVFLAVIPTHKLYYDLPKGVQNENENITNTLIREVKEEIGIDIQQHKNKIQKIGRYKYRKGKDIVMFVLKLDELPKTSSMKCISMFKIKDKEYPEVGQFKYLRIDNLGGFRENMARIIEDVIKKI
jgi:predicted NUDIX family NTP pyrophosphohydrolase